jgi:hypothetical protein
MNNSRIRGTATEDTTKKSKYMSYDYMLGRDGLTHPTDTLAAAWDNATRAVTSGYGVVGLGYDGNAIVTLRSLGPRPIDIPFSRQAHRSCGSCRTQKPEKFVNISPPGPNSCSTGGCRKKDTPRDGVVVDTDSNGNYTATYYTDGLPQKFNDQFTSTTPCTTGACDLPINMTQVTPQTVPPQISKPSLDKLSPDYNQISVLIVGDFGHSIRIKSGLHAAYNRFPGTTHLPENFALNVKSVSNDYYLREHILGNEKCDVIIVSQLLNETLEICKETGYNGSLLLIGGATCDMIDQNITIPESISSVVLTHGFVNGAIISESDYHALVGSVPSWVYVNDRDDLSSIESLIGMPYENRDYESPYIIEIVRALKLGHLGIDWRELLITRLGPDSNLVQNVWS